MSQETNIPRIPQEIEPVLAPSPTAEALGRVATALELVDQEPNVFLPDWRPNVQLSKDRLPAIATPDKPNRVIAVQDDDEEPPIAVPVVPFLAEHTAAHVQSAHRPDYFEEPPRRLGRHAR